MIIYFADRDLNILGSASNALTGGFIISDDLKTSEIESGVSTFSASIGYMGDNRVALETMVAVGNYVLRSNGEENEFYTIVTTEYNTAGKEVNFYAEDAGLDLLNTVAPAYEAPEAHDAEWYVNKYIDGTGWEIGLNELPDSTKKLTWDGESTVTERLVSIANSFRCELSFSYEVKGLEVTHRYINMHQERGNGTADKTLRLEHEVASITVNKSIENLATAYNCVGNSTKITLSGCDYSSDGTNTHSPALADDPYQIVGKQVRCIPAMERWSTRLDTDGLIVRPYTYNTSDKQKLFSHAVAELRKYVEEETSYAVELRTLPPNTRIGDRVYVVDDAGEMYIEARILTLEASITGGTYNCTLGEFVTREAGISAQLANLAERLQTTGSAIEVKIQSSNGIVFAGYEVKTVLSAEVSYGTQAVRNEDELENVFGETAFLQWQYYEDEAWVDCGTGFQLVLNETIGATKRYRCLLVS